MCRGTRHESRESIKLTNYQEGGTSRMSKPMHPTRGYSLSDPVSVKASSGRVKLQIGFGVGRGGSRNSELTPVTARRIAVQLIRAAERVTVKSN